MIPANYFMILSVILFVLGAVAFFIITVAAAEAAVGLAIILLIFRQKKTIKTEDIKLMKG